MALNLIVRLIRMISVIIPTHNRGKIVARAVNSVLSSTVLPAEIIVIEDNSFEASETLVDHIKAGQVTYYKKADGMASASATRNFGVSKASERYVLFLDDDDTISPDYIRLLMDYLSSGQCKWGFGDILINGKVAKFRHSHSAELNNVKFKLKMAGIGAGFWIDRELYIKLGGLDELQRIDEDTDLCCRLIGSGFNPWYIKAPATKVSRHDGLERLTSTSNAKDKVDCYSRTLHKNFAYFPLNSEAREFLLDRVHRSICQYGDLDELNILLSYRIPIKLKIIQRIRQLFLKQKTQQ